MSCAFRCRPRAATSTKRDSQKRSAGACGLTPRCSGDAWRTLPTRAAAQYGRQFSDRVPSRRDRRGRDQAGGAAMEEHLRVTRLLAPARHWRAADTGGLLLGDEGDAQLGSRASFPLTQDQRHTIRGRASYHFSSAGWLRSPDGTGAVCRSKTSTTRLRTRWSSGASVSWTV